MSTKPDEFVKLTVRNSWGSDYLFAPGPAADADTVDERAALEFKKGQKVKVQWPSGLTETVKLKIRIEKGNVWDMGHTYKTSSKIPVFDALINGLSVEIRLADVLVRASDCKTAQ